MVSRMTCCRGARGQLALYNPHLVPAEVAQELEGIYGFQPKEAVGCLADVMISQRTGLLPPAAFMLIYKSAGNSLESTINRLLRAEKAFKHAFAIAILPIPHFAELQLLAISKSMQIKIFPVFSLVNAVKLMVWRAINFTIISSYFYWCRCRFLFMKN